MGFNYEKDPALLLELFSHRHLQSGQLARLLDRSSQVVRRRIRKFLMPQGYVLQLPRDTTEEAAYGLGRLGFEYIAEIQDCSVEELPCPRDARRRKPHQWKHTLLCNNVRITLELALREHPDLILERTIPEWEIQNHRAKKEHERILLYELLWNGDRTKEHRFKPDLLSLIRYPSNQLVAFFHEMDRTTEAVDSYVKSSIRNKIYSYYHYYKQQLHKARFDADFMCVLFSLEAKTHRRIRTMQQLLQQMAEELGDPKGEDEAFFMNIFRFANAADLTLETIVDGEVWQNWKGEPRSLYSSS